MLTTEQQNVECWTAGHYLALVMGKPPLNHIIIKNKKIEVFIKYKILFLETIISTYTRTHIRKGEGINGGESGVRNLEAESIRSRVESTRGCV